MNAEVESVKQCILGYKVKDIETKVKEAIDAGVEPSVILNDGMVDAMTEIGEGFKNNNIYMPQMLMAAKTMQIGLQVLKPYLAGDASATTASKAIVGSVLGDVHDIGKNLVATMLQGAGYEIVDLGADVDKSKYTGAIDANPETKIVAISSAMTPTREALRDTVQDIKARPDSSGIMVMVGGATMDQSFSDEIHADVYTVDAASAAERAKDLASGESISQVSENSRRIANDAMRSKESVEEAEAEESADESGAVPRHKQLSGIRRAGEAGHFERKPLTVKENFAETLKHDKGCPDRFVEQYGAFDILFDPVLIHARNLQDEFFNPKPSYIDGWGVHQSIPAGAGGSHPVHGPGLTVISDITKWQDQLKTVPPTLSIPSAEWDPVRAQAKQIEESGKHAALWIAGGLFEKIHFLLGMDEALRAYYEHPEEMHELVEFMTDWEIECIDKNMEEVDNISLLFHHDDWGTAINSFLDPQTHRDFFEKPYSRIYGHFKELGGEYVVHHSDSWAANLVPVMIDAGADVWQGAIDANNIPSLIDQYGDKIVFMGGIDDAVVDIPNWDRKQVYDYTVAKIRENGPNSYIPCLTRGLGVSIYDGVYDTITEAIRDTNKEFF